MTYLDLFEEKVDLQRKANKEHQSTETILDAEAEAKKPAFF